MPDRRERQQELERRMADLSVDLVFLPPSADLEYLTGFKRRILTFGNIEYAHSWVTGCFFAPGREPAFVLPRMVTAFDLPEGLSGDVTIVNELDDGEAMFFALAKTYGPVRKLALGARTWSDTTLKLMQAFGGAALISGDLLLNPMRRVKSKDELVEMAKACRLVDQVMGEVTPRIVAGVTELELARDIDYAMRSKGSLVPSFDTGVWGMGAGQRARCDRPSFGWRGGERVGGFFRFRRSGGRLLFGLRQDRAGGRAVEGIPPRLRRRHGSAGRRNPLSAPRCPRLSGQRRHAPGDRGCRPR